MSLGQRAIARLREVFQVPANAQIDPERAILAMCERIVRLNTENEMYKAMLVAGAFDAGTLEGCATPEDAMAFLALPRPIIEWGAVPTIQQIPAGLVSLH